MVEEEKTIKQFLSFVNQGKLKGLKCKSCSKIIVPPRTQCSICNTSDFEWVDLKGTGELLTYTVIHVPPKKFKDEAPYVIGIVKLDEGVKLEGRINGVDVINHEKELRTGMRMVFNSDSSILAFKKL